MILFDDLIAVNIKVGLLVFEFIQVTLSGHCEKTT